ncbi:MAG: NAD(P)/FAD-dependent oxidoreductase [Actinomycetota bacterium]
MDRPVVVVGGGIVGSAIAFELQDRGVETILVERDLEPQGASAFSFASVSGFDEGVRDVYLLKCLGMVRWREWSKRFGGDIGIEWGGEIRWAEDPEGADDLRAKMEMASFRGYPFRSTSTDEIERLLPGAAPGPILAASYAAEDGQADPLTAITFLRDAFADRGGAVLIGRANLLFDAPDVRVRVGEDEIEASTVVFAAGAETGALLTRFGWEIPLDPSPGLLVGTEPVERFLTGVVYVSAGGGPAIHLRQLPDGRVLIGERSQDEVAKDPTMHHARKLLHQAQRSFPVLDGVRVERFTVEWRPMPRDHMPIVGALPGLPSVYVAAAHSGVTLAPALGDLVAQEIIAGEPSARLDAFRPGRFSAHTIDAYISFEEAFQGRSEAFLG